jgi:hypothetical protein
MRGTEDLGTTTDVRMSSGSNAHAGKPSGQTSKAWGVSPRDGWERHVVLVYHGTRVPGR